MKRIIFLVLSFFFLFPVLAVAQTAQSQEFEAIIVDVQIDPQADPQDLSQYYRQIIFVGQEGEWDGERYSISASDISTTAIPDLNVGDRVIITQIIQPDGSRMLLITDYVRRPALFILFGLFVLITLLVARFQGLASLLGMGFSFVIIFYWILPNILGGHDPLFTTIAACAIIIPVNFYLSHGISLKTHVAVVGTLISLLITGLLAQVFIGGARLSGFGSEEAGFLQYLTGGEVDMRALLLAGIIISLIGVLDDITISQSAIVAKLKEANKKYSPQKLFVKAMDVGKDHIASLVNTLILVYTGAALPLLLLFLQGNHPYLRVLNYEMIAEEIVRTLIASIGLILAVPITTLIASLAHPHNPKGKSSATKDTTHSHHSH